MKTNFICVNEAKDRKYVEHPDYIKAQIEAIRLHQKEGDSIRIYKLIAEVRRSTEFIIEPAFEGGYEYISGGGGGGGKLR